MGKDLIILVADADIEFGIRGILERPRAIGIRAPLSVDLRRHSDRDPGCFLRGPEFLRPFVNQYQRALVVHDLHGCGRDQQPRAEIEADLEGRLRAAGWGNRAAAVVIDPEIEAWVWSDSPKVDEVLGWKDRTPNLRAWLLREGHVAALDAKPADPKSAMEAALAASGKAGRSSSYYRELGRVVGLDRCIDPAFMKFRRTLRGWFPAD